MQRRVFTTASFKLTLFYAAVFSISVLVLAMLMFFSIRSSLYQQIRAHIEADTAQLLGDYRDDGMDELRHDIRERMEKKIAERLYYSVQDADGRAIFDRLPLIKTPGWQRFDERMLLVNTSALGDGYMLIVAADTSRIQALERFMLKRFLVALGITVLVGLLGGLWASKRFLNRVDALAKTTERIGDGFLSERIALSGSHDEFDQLATTINHMLGRIELLVGNLQHVSTSIAHDLRTPLGRVRQKLEAMGDAAPVQEAMTLIDEALATFSALLRIAEIESGSRRAGFVFLSLSDLLQRLIDMYGPQAEENQQQLTATIAGNVRVTGDAALLTQLIANLLENAMLHAGEGCRIEVTLTPDAQVSVADNGSGIPAAEREAVLRPFYRLDRSRTEKGNGLGLNLANAIVALHNASMRLEDNQPGLRVTIMGLK